MNFRDEDTPLSYKFFFYWDEDLYEEERELGVNPVNSRRDFVSDTLYINELTTRLPMGRASKSMEILLMASVSDSLGAVTNTTKKIKVDLKYPSSLE